MRAQQAHGHRAPGAVPRVLWSGVLPEALGLCFVFVLLAGFTAAYFIADIRFTRSMGAMQRAEAELLAGALALAIRPADPDGASISDEALQALARRPRIVRLEWKLPDGRARFAWPRALVLPGLESPPDENSLTRASAPVTTTDGVPAGELAVAVRSAAMAHGRAGLMIGWGMIAGLTLLVFTAVYYRLRAHLRPMMAIERNLLTCAEGLERNLATLALSDALGSVAVGWNHLLSEIGLLQRQLEQSRATSGNGDALERFESALFRRIVERLPVGVLCLAEDRTVSYANAAAGAQLGTTADELRGKSLTAVVTDPSLPGVLDSLRPGSTTVGTCDFLRGEGEQQTAVRVRAVPLGMRVGGGELLVALEDVSALRENQRARDNFLYHVTHELRTPLTNIHAYAETLTKPDFDDEQTRKECYNVIISETRRLSSLVENILSISQLEVGTARLDLGEVDLLRLVRQMVQDNLGNADEKHIDLLLTVPPKLPKVRGDKQRLSVLLNNLIGNAIKYTPSGGQVEVGVTADADMLRISVRDNGIGISAADQAHVFEKFYRAATDEVQLISGTGLGLAIAREVARLHGGEIRLESELSKGSTFTVELPLANAAHAEA